MDQLSELKSEIATLKGIQSAMPDPYYVRDLDYNIVLWPESIQKLTGYSKEEAQELKCYQMLRASACPRALGGGGGDECPTQNCVMKRTILRDIAIDIHRKDGAAVPALVSIAGIYDDAGNPVGAVEIVKDNTSLHQLSSFVSSATEQVDGEANRKISLSLNAVSDSMKKSTEKFYELKSNSETIIQAVEEIEKLAHQINILSINASIEATRVGEAGKGFEVVAKEVKNLAQNSSNSAKNIRTVQETMIEHMDKFISLFDETQNNFNSSTTGINEMLNFMRELEIEFENYKSSL